MRLLHWLKLLPTWNQRVTSALDQLEALVGEYERAEANGTITMDEFRGLMRAFKALATDVRSWF